MVIKVVVCFCLFFLRTDTRHLAQCNILAKPVWHFIISVVFLRLSISWNSLMWARREVNGLFIFLPTLYTVSHHLKPNFKISCLVKQCSKTPRTRLAFHTPQALFEDLMINYRSPEWVSEWGDRCIHKLALRPMNNLWDETIIPIFRDKEPDRKD